MGAQGAAEVEHRAGIDQASDNLSVLIYNRAARTELSDNFTRLSQTAAGHNPAEIAAFQICRRCSQINGKTDNFSFGVGNTAVRAHSPDQIVLIDNLAVISNKTDVFTVVVKGKTRPDYLTDNLIVFIINIAVGLNKTNCLRLKIGNVAARRNASDKSAVQRNDHFGRYQTSIQQIIVANLAVGITVRRNETNLLSLKIGIKTVTGQTADGFAIVGINQSRKQNCAENIEIIVDNQTIRQNLADNLSGSQPHRTVVGNLTQKLVVVADGNALRNDAADKLAVKINNQAVGGNIADKLIVETDNLTVGNNLAYKIAVEVDGRNFNCRSRSSKKQHGEKGKCPHTRPDFIQKF